MLVIQRREPRERVGDSDSLPWWEGGSPALLWMFALLALLLFGSQVFSQTRPPITVKRLEQPPVIDRRLEEDEWVQAAVLTDFYQTQPGDNSKPSHPTEVFLGYDNKFL
jgi:hypothetical protein